MQHSSLAPKAAAGPARGSRVQSVDRAMMLLRAVADAKDADTSAAMLAESCGLNRATAWRILQHPRDARRRHLRPLDGSLGGRHGAGRDRPDRRHRRGLQAAHAVLERLSLQTGETASLAVPDGVGLTYVDEVAPSAIVSATWRGRTVPLHATSTGKALLAFGDPDVVRRLTATALRRYTDTTVTDPAALLDELAEVALARLGRLPRRVRLGGLGRLVPGPRRPQPSGRRPQRLGPRDPRRRLALRRAGHPLPRRRPHPLPRRLNPRHCAEQVSRRS